MTDAMAYRGPDGISHSNLGAVALGYCAMHTTSESRADSQPLASRDGHIRVMLDGYISNYDALRAELRQHGCVLRSKSEAELVLRAYETWGQDCPRHIDGEATQFEIELVEADLTQPGTQPAMNLVPLGHQ